MMLPVAEVRRVYQMGRSGGENSLASARMDGVCAESLPGASAEDRRWRAVVVVSGMYQAEGGWLAVVRGEKRAAGGRWTTSTRALRRADLQQLRRRGQCTLSSARRGYSSDLLGVALFSSRTNDMIPRRLPFAHHHLPRLLADRRPWHVGDCMAAATSLSVVKMGRRHRRSQGARCSREVASLGRVVDGVCCPANAAAAWSERERESRGCDADAV